MCDKHVPIIVYDSGGQQVYCGKCGIPLGEWKQNEGHGKHPQKTKKEQTVQAVHS